MKVIKPQTRNIFNTGCQVFVIPVNVVGAMGKGLADQFKSLYPDAYHVYNQRCRAGYIVAGALSHPNLLSLGEQHVLFFPTKEHWSAKSELPWIEEGLLALPSVMAAARLKSIAIPAIGCGEGGLDWYGEVKPLILKLLADSDLVVELYDQ